MADAASIMALFSADRPAKALSLMKKSTSGRLPTSRGSSSREQPFEAELLIVVGSHPFGRIQRAFSSNWYTSPPGMLCGTAPSFCMTSPTRPPQTHLQAP